MNRFAAALALAALAFPGAALAAEHSARYTLQIELATAAAHETVQGTGVVDAERGLASLAFSMSVRGKTSTGNAVIVSSNGITAYIRGLNTSAPAGKPWGRFPGDVAVPLFDPGVALRLRPAGRALHVRVTVPAAEVPLLFPVAPHARVLAELWRDAAGRVVRLRASVDVTSPARGTISIDERLSSFGVPVDVLVPREDQVFASITNVPPRKKH